MTREQKKIIVVDDNNSNLVACKKTLKPFYEVYSSPSAEKMFELLEHITPDLILLDVEMPDCNGYEAARMLKSKDAFREIPIIFVTGRIDPTSEMVGMNLGAMDYVHKPFVSAQLLRRIKLHLSLIDYRKKGNILSLKNQEMSAIIDTLNAAADTGDIGKMRACVTEASNVTKQLTSLVTEILAISKIEANEE